MQHIKVNNQSIKDFCVRNGIHKLSLFGSILRDDFNSNSDVDMLVEFEPETRIGLFGIARLELELSDLIGKKVDLRTPEELSRYFRDEVLRSAQVQYETGR